MAKRKYKKNDFNLKNLLLLIVIVLFLALIIPLIGTTENTPTLWISIVDFFVLIKEHFMAFWMFYSFGLLVLLATRLKK